MLHESKLNVECKKVESRVQTQMANTKCRIDCVKYNVKCNIEFWRKWNAIIAYTIRIYLWIIQQTQPQLFANVRKHNSKRIFAL